MLETLCSNSIAKVGGFTVKLQLEATNAVEVNDYVVYLGIGLANGSSNTIKQVMHFSVMCCYLFVVPTTIRKGRNSNVGSSLVGSSSLVAANAKAVC